MRTLPADIFTNETKNVRRLKTQTVNREESFMAQGKYFVGVREQVGVSVSDVAYTVVKSNGKWLIIEDLITNIDFSLVTDGQFAYSLNAYVDGSSGNSWTYSGGTPFPAGRPVNAQFINDMPGATVIVDVTVNDLTGVADYPVFFTDYYIDTQGNRNTISTTAGAFFDDGRKILLPPGSEMLIVASSTGDATGTATVRTQFFISELEEAEASS